MTGTLQRIILGSGGALAAVAAATTLVVVTAPTGDGTRSANRSGPLSEVVLRPDGSHKNSAGLQSWRRHDDPVG